MPVEIQEVLEVGPGWNKVRGTDGNVYTLKGDYNWRSNNPGNIEYGPFAISQGAIASGAVPPGRERGFAIFPSLSAGEAARAALQFESPSYSNLSVSQAINRYAPPSENNTQAYINAVTQAAGISPSTRMSDLTPQQRAAFLEAQARVEGNMRQGDIYNAQGIRLPPAEIPNIVASQLDVVRPNSAYRPTPATQSNTIAAQRSLIPENASPALKAALARLASQSTQAKPVTQSRDLALERNPVMSQRAREQQVTPYPATASPALQAVRNIGSPQGNPYAGIFGNARASLPPLAGQNQDHVGAFPSFSQLRGLFGATPVNNAPVPANPSLVTRTMRALGTPTAGLQQALNQYVRPNIAPVPMPASARPANRIVIQGGNYIQPSVSSGNGGGSSGMTVVQALQGQGLSPSNAYDMANQLARERARENAGKSNSSSDYFKSVTGG